MNLKIAHRTEAFFEFDKCKDYIINPAWMCAPYELLQFGDSQEHPVVGPYRFLGRDIEQAEKYALDGNWGELQKLSVPQRIPP